MRSLRRELIVRTVAGAVAVLAVAGVLLYAFVRAGMVAEFDRSLIDKARTLAATTDQTQEGVDLDFQELDLRRLDQTAAGGYLQVWVSGGGVLYRSTSLGKADLDRVDGTLESPGVQWTTLPDGRSGREVGISFIPQRDTGENAGADDAPAPAPQQPLRTVTMVLAHDTAKIDSVLARLSALLLLIGLLAVVVCSAVLWSAVYSSLRPLDKLAGQISALGEQDLSSRVAADPPLRELQPVCERLNDLLERLEAAFRRERAFSSDVAHELRTPLAGLRSILEVALSRQRAAGQYREALGDSLQVTGKMEAMVGRLLSLARLEAGQVAVKAQPLDPDELIDAAWEPLAAGARARSLHVERAPRARRTVTTDPVLLSRVLANVLENAVEYADEGGRMSIRIAETDNGIEVCVSNSCDAMTPEEADNTLKRFWRRDASRTAEGDHCGLGLPVAEKIMATLGGSLSVRSGEEGGFKVIIALPSGPPGAA